MGVLTFMWRNSDDEWTAKEHSGDLEASASSSFEPQRKLVQTALFADSFGGVQSSFSLVIPSSAVFQVIIRLGGDEAAAAPAGGVAPAADAPPAEEKEEKEESDDDMGFSLFD